MRKAKILEKEVELPYTNDRTIAKKISMKCRNAILNDKGGITTWKKLKK